MILNDWQPVSTSGHVALYPALASPGNGRCAGAWYEYSSADRPARSDIWFASQRDDEPLWGGAANISRGVSYNNGPSLLALGEDQFLVAWHSWRPPGRDPFLADGDVCNVWLSRSHGAQWGDPVLAFPELSQTEYASLATVADRIQLACYHRETRRILLSESTDGLHWEPPSAFPSEAGRARFPSLAALPNGTLALACTMAGDPALWLSTKKAGEPWSEPERICELPGEKLAKPKLSIDSTGAMWVACQTEHWGSFGRSFRIDVGGEPFVELAVRSKGGAGNAMWTLNEIDFLDPSGISRKCIRFGPEPNPANAARCHVSAGDWAYSAVRGCGFDAPVEELFRELGSEVTRRLVFSPEPRRLRIDLPPGSYVMKVTSSSWIASRPALDLQASVPCEEIAPLAAANDRCYFFRQAGGGPFDLAASTPAEQEHNRPSAVCEIQSGQFQLAWTSFAGDAVQIVTQRLNIP